MWKEETVASGVITNGNVKVYDGTNTTGLPARISAQQYGSSGGYVLYQDNSKLYAWSPTGGPKLLFDSVPEFAAISGSTVYFLKDSISDSAASGTVGPRFLRLRFESECDHADELIDVLCSREPRA